MKPPMTESRAGRSVFPFILATTVAVGVALDVLDAAAAVTARIHDAQEVLAALVSAPSGASPQSGAGQSLQFVDGNGRAWDLVTDINDPVIVNHGSGSFHAASATEVQNAINALSHDGVGDLTVDIYLLPYPRRELLASSADESGIYVSPGVWAYSPAQLHALVIHELGHAYQYTFLPDSDAEGWAQYRGLRGITDTSIYYNGAAHRNRPHEIFAEDFRVLFGGALANYSQSVENSSLAYPADVPGLAGFMGGLASRQADAGGDDFALVSSPNPFNPLTTIRFQLPYGEHEVALTIVDANGRLVRSLVQQRLSAGAYEYRWDGRDETNQRAASGVYFARLEAGAQSSNYKLILAR